jgi:hypothetical protein
MDRRDRPKRIPKPLDSVRLEELALAYVARFATSAAKLEDYLRRKLRERGWDGEGDPPVGPIAAKFVANGFIDDLAYARAKSGSLSAQRFAPVKAPSAAPRWPWQSSAGSGHSARLSRTAQCAKSRSPHCCAPGTGWTAPANWSMPAMKPPRRIGRGKTTKKRIDDARCSAVRTGYGAGGLFAQQR